jgi:predicted  nucleic acid-binding Zn-ribbon protein
MAVFVDKMVEEMKAKPYTMIVLVGLVMSVGFLTKAQIGLASEKEVASLSVRLDDLSNTVKVSALEQRLAAINDQLFAATQKIAEIRAKHHDPDDYLIRRERDLEDEKDRVKQELASLPRPR